MVQKRYYTKKIDNKEEEYDFIIEWEEAKNQINKNHDTIKEEDTESGIKKWLQKIKIGEDKGDSADFELDDDY